MKLRRDCILYGTDGHRSDLVKSLKINNERFTYMVSSMIYSLYMY